MENKSYDAAYESWNGVNVHINSLTKNEYFTVV